MLTLTGILTYINTCMKFAEDWGKASPVSGRMNTLNSHLKCLVADNVQHLVEDTQPRG